MAFTDKAWDGSAGRWPDAASYCKSCMVDNNAAGAEKTKSDCHFPIKEPNGDINVNALRAVVGGRGAQADFPGAAAAREKARKMLASYSNANGGRSREEFRALPEGDYELRDEGGAPVLAGHLAVFDEWAEINSSAEGHFLERIAPSAFDKTIAENRDRMRVLFNHGKDPSLGEQPLGKIRSLAPDSKGVAYEVELFDGIPPLIMSGLRGGGYGSSFRFEVLREHRERSPERSDYNPRRLPERTVKEVRMSEFGPVTFPAYAGATAGLRSLTDRMLLERVDTEDLDCLAQMVSLGSSYIDEQDDPGDEVNIPKMKAVLEVLLELQQYEMAEDEPEEDEEMASADERAADADAPPPDRAAPAGHPIYAGRREERVPLYGEEKGQEWRL